VESSSKKDGGRPRGKTSCQNLGKREVIAEKEGIKKTRRNLFQLRPGWTGGREENAYTHSQKPLGTIH